MSDHATTRLAGLSDNKWPQIQSTSLETGADSSNARLALLIGAEVCWFEGHFPGYPVLAGVVQLHWATEMGRRLFDIESDFLGVENLKFMRTIEPDTALYLILEYSTELKRIAFCYTNNEGDFSKGRIRFV